MNLVGDNQERKFRQKEYKTRIRIGSKSYLDLLVSSDPDLGKNRSACVIIYNHYVVRIFFGYVSYNTLCPTGKKIYFAYKV